MDDDVWEQIEQTARTAQETGEGETAVKQIIAQLAQADLLETSGVARLYRDLPQEDAEELLSTANAARKVLGVDGTVDVLGTAVTHSSPEPGDLSAADIVTAIESHHGRKQTAQESDDFGRPSKVDPMFERLVAGDLGEASRRKRALAVFEFREDVAKNTWHKLVDRAEGTDLAPKELLDDGRTYAREIETGEETGDLEAPPE